MLVLSSFDSAEAEPSTIEISSDSDSGDILKGDFGRDEGITIFTLTLDSEDIRYRHMEVYMVAVWPGDIAWTSKFLDEDGEVLEENIVRLHKADRRTIHIMIVCDDLCSAGYTNTLNIYGITDPTFIPTDYGEGEDPGNHTDTCGSADCKNDTTPASASSNRTNTISFSLTARLVYDSTTCLLYTSDAADE